MAGDIWAVGAVYEGYIGRWSRRVAVDFLSWLSVPAGLRWADIGSGTGALTQSILANAAPTSVVGIEQSAQFVEHASAAVVDDRAHFEVGDAQSVPLPDGSVEVVVSGLVLNFVPEPARALSEFVRVTVEGGHVASYVWDYAEGMRMLRVFWDAAAELDPAAAERDEVRRFGICQPQPLTDLWTSAGLAEVAVTAIDVPTVFVSFDDYWTPFLGGQGPAPGYVSSLDQAGRDALRDLLYQRLPIEDDGTIRLTARAWAVRGQRP